MHKSSVSLQRGKSQLNRVDLLGEGVKDCQGRRDQYLCCNLKTISLIQNCPYDCSYCFLQFYLTSGETKIVEDVEPVKRALRALSQNNSTKLFRVTTGELSDSLALEGIARHLKELIPVIESLPNVVLELKTKSANITPLLRMKPSKTFVSFSLNPSSFAKQEEQRAAKPIARIQAAKQLMDSGYCLSFHFDPLVAFSGWEGDYQDLVKTLCTTISPEHVLYVSLGSLRFRPSLYRTLLFHKPQSQLFSQELFLSEDGKLRYPLFLRKRLYRKVLHFLRERWRSVPVYLCMESKEAWEGVIEDVPRDGTDLENRLLNSICQKMLGAKKTIFTGTKRA